MKRGKKLTRAQKVLIGKTGLFHTDWLCHYEDDECLYLVAKNKSPSEFKIIDKKKKVVWSQEETREHTGAED